MEILLVLLTKLTTKIKVCPRLFYLAAFMTRNSTLNEEHCVFGQRSTWVSPKMYRIPSIKNVQQVHTCILIYTLFVLWARNPINKIENNIMWSPTPFVSELSLLGWISRGGDTLGGGDDHPLWIDTRSSRHDSSMFQRWKICQVVFILIIIHQPELLFGYLWNNFTHLKLNPPYSK